MDSVRFNKNAFFRKYGNIGYIINQITKNDRVYDEIGAIFFEQIKKHSVRIEQITDNLSRIFTDTPKNVIQDDLESFLKEIGEEFIIIDDDFKNESFSYKNFVVNKQRDHDFNHPSTSDIMEQCLSVDPRIIDFQIELTSKCNLTCIHCYHPFHRKSVDIQKEILVDILKQLKELGTINITFTGGEPLLYKPLKEILSISKENDFSISLLSNGTLIDDGFIGIFKDINIGLIQLSLYSTDYEDHDRITGVEGSCKKTIKAIQKLIDSDIPLQIGCPIMKDNLNSFYSVLQFCKPYNIKVNFDFLIFAKTNFSRENLLSRLDLKECELAIKRIIEYDEEYRDILLNYNTNQNLRKPDSHVCGVGTSMMCITPNGDLYPCPGFKMILGNAGNRSIKDIWENSKNMIELREMKNSSFVNCINCISRNYCSICLSRNYNENHGDYKKIPEFFCKVGQLNRKLAEEWKNKQLTE